MTGNEAASLVRTLRRHLMLATVARVLLLSIVLLGFVGSVAAPAGDRGVDALWLAAVLAAGGWVMLAVFSARQVRATNQASVYISTGRLDLAEEQLKSAMQLVSLYRTGKLLVCHNLAVVAHGQKNYSVAAVLCDGLLAAGVGVSRGLGRMCRILLADCRLFLGDTRAAVKAIAPLRLDDPKLSLSEKLMLLPIELRCQISQGEYRGAVDSLDGKVGLAELLDSPKAALVHAMLARACRSLGKSDQAAFLMNRARLYHDLDELELEYPILRDSANESPLADNNTAKS